MILMAMRAETPTVTNCRCFGVNDPLGCDPFGANCTGLNPHFDPVVFSEFTSWSGLKGGKLEVARASIARGQQLFDTKAIRIAGVSGINDDFNVAAVTGTCT